MALVIRGRSVCSICGKSMDEAERLVLFPPMFPNRQSPLHPFNDAALHQKCFESHPLGKMAREFLEAYLHRGAPGQKRRCHVCNELINDPEDYFSTGLLTEDSASALFGYNFLYFHRSHFLVWERASWFRQEVEHLQTSSDWEGPRIVFDPTPRWTT